MKTIRLLFIALMLMSLTNFAEAQYKIGDKVQDFSLKNVNGKMVSLADYTEAKGFILIFSCNHCPFVHKYESRIKYLHANYAPKGFPVIAINSNDEKISPGDSYDEMKKRYKAQGYRFAYLYDQTQEVAAKFGAERTPHVYVLNKKQDGIVLEYFGTIDNNVDNASKADKKYVQDAVNALLENSKPPVTETKAVGCTIKWRK